MAVIDLINGTAQDIVGGVELRHLRYFLAAIEAGSLTAAAERLHMSQPALSQAMVRLETEVGVPLLIRSSRGIQPTSAGRYLLDASTRVLGDLDEITTTLRQMGEGAHGSLSITAVPVLMWSRLPALLRTVRGRAPELAVSVIDPPPWTAIDMLEANRVDMVALVVADPEPFARLHSHEFTVLDWGPVPLVAALPPDALDVPDPLPLAAFGDATLVLPRTMAAVTSLPEAVEAALEANDVQPREIRRVETIQVSLPLVESGAAWTILPDPDRRSLDRFRLTIRELDPMLPPLRALVLAKHAAAQHGATRHVLDIIANERRSNATHEHLH